MVNVIERGRKIAVDGKKETFYNGWKEWQLIDIIGSMEKLMAIPQRDEMILRRSTNYGGRVEEIKWLDALLEYAVMHGDEAARLVEGV